MSKENQYQDSTAGQQVHDAQRTESTGVRDHVHTGNQDKTTEEFTCNSRLWLKKTRRWSLPKCVELSILCENYRLFSIFWVWRLCGMTRWECEGQEQGMKVPSRTARHRGVNTTKRRPLKLTKLPLKKMSWSKIQELPRVCLDFTAKNLLNRTWVSMPPSQKREQSR